MAVAQIGVYLAQIQKDFCFVSLNCFLSRLLVHTKQTNWSGFGLGLGLVHVSNTKITNLIKLTMTHERPQEEIAFHSTQSTGSVRDVDALCTECSPHDQINDDRHRAVTFPYHEQFAFQSTQSTDCVRDAVA